MNHAGFESSDQCRKKIHKAGFMYTFIYNAHYRMNHQKIQAFYCLKNNVTLKFFVKAYKIDDTQNFIPHYTL